ncbi:hypothetical protein [Sphingomonas sp.]|jgi:hypothetical protein|uniref:hypothetical protein n=1 Tax=Sphingomonas sp. TaxID=28214 RepID=UPI002E37002F|nr:hypothetical protein [Sphingomonas sp.]HEX4693571.1 hypothetical protein [Sphingomonas sp.]
MREGGATRLAEFAELLRGQRIAIVYSHRFGAPLDEDWYHRWQTNVIAMFSQAAEHCGAIPVFFDLDQWLDYCSASPKGVQFVVNLNAGNRSLDQWSVVPALAGWRGLVTFPCSAFTALLGEDKAIAKRLARDCGWHIPRGIEEGLSARDQVIRKPRTYGSSVGLERLTLAEVHNPEDPDYIVEEFVRGYDATIVTFYSTLTGRLECHGAQAITPETDDPANWTYDAYEKRNPGVRTVVASSYYPVDHELAQRAVEITQVFGGKFVSRVDIRLKCAPSATAPIRFEDCTFLEINPMPTIGPSNSVTELAARYVEQHGDHPDLSWIATRSSNPIERAAIYLLSAGLLALSSR